MAPGNRGVEVSAQAPPGAFPSGVLSSFAGMIEGGVLKVFGSNTAAGEGGAGGQDGSVQQQQQEDGEKHRPASAQEQTPPRAAKPTRTSSEQSMESDLPELGRLERSPTSATLTPSSHEPRDSNNKKTRSTQLQAFSTGGARLSSGSRAATSSASSVVSGETAKDGGNGGGGGGKGGKGGRWARNGEAPTSNASTLVPGMSPAITPAADAGKVADFHASSALDGRSGNNAAAGNGGGGAAISDGDSKSGPKSNASNIPEPLDMSAIPVAAPPPNRGRGKPASSSTSSAASTKPVVLQGAALESLKRLGRPGSSVSDRSKGVSSTRGGAGGGAGAPLDLPIPMGVPLGSAAPSLGSNQLLSRRQQKHVRSDGISKEFHTTGSFLDGAGRNGGGGGGGGPGWARSESDASAAGGKGPAAVGNGLTVGRAVLQPLDDDGSSSSSDDQPPPPSPMLTAHLRPGPKAGRDPPPSKQQRGASDSQPAAGRARAFKGRGVRPQTWNEEDGADTSPHSGGGDGGGGGGSGGGGAANGSQHKGSTHSNGVEAQQQQQHQQQRQQQIQMRLVARNPRETGASHNTFLVDQVSPGALSMVSCSTAYSRRSGARSRYNGSFNDSDGHLDTLADVAADIAKRGSVANAELVTGLGREAFERVSISPGMPSRGNDLAGVSRAIPSEALPGPAVGQVPSLSSRHVAPSGGGGGGGGSVLSVTSSNGSGRSGKTDGGRRHVLAPHGSRSGVHDDHVSVSPTGAYGLGHGGGMMRLDAPSLTVAHAPGQINRPVAKKSGSQHPKPKPKQQQQQQQQQPKRPSGPAVARGTPAHHSTGVHQHGVRQAGGGDGEPPFRLPSSVRLTSFGSLASSVASPPLHGGPGEDWDWQQPPPQQQQLLQKEESAGGGKRNAAATAAHGLGEDTSTLARRPTTIDMLSTFGSHSYGHSRGDIPAAGPSPAGGRSRSSVAGEDSDGGADGGNGRADASNRRRSCSSTRRASHREDRISQRRSRSSGSHGGGTRRFGAASGFMVAESDDSSVRGSGRGRRRMASRSMSGGDGLGSESTEPRRGDEPRVSGHVRNGSASNTPPAGGAALSPDGLAGSAAAEREPDHSSQQPPRSSESKTPGRGRPRKKESSPSRARPSSLRVRGTAAAAAAATGGGGKALSPSWKTPHRRSDQAGAGVVVGGGGGGGGGGGKKHHRRRSSNFNAGGTDRDVAGIKSVLVVTPADAPAGTVGGGGGGGSSDRGSKRGVSSRRRRTDRKDGEDSAVPTAAEKGAGAGVADDDDSSRGGGGGGRIGGGPLAGDGRAGSAVVAGAAETGRSSSGSVVRHGDLDRAVDVSPRREGSTAVSSGASDGSRDGRRRLSKGSKKPSIAQSEPRPSGARKTPTIKKRKVRRFLAIASLFRRRGPARSRSDSDSSDDIFDEGDESTAVATTLGHNSARNSNNNGNGGGGGGNAARGFTRSESVELTTAARRTRGSGGFVGWIWRTVTRQQLQRGRNGGGGGGGGGRRSPGSSGRRSPASSGKRSPAGGGGGGDDESGVSPALAAVEAESVLNGERRTGLAPAPVVTAAAAKPLAFKPHQPQSQSQHRPMSLRNSLPRISALRPKSLSLGHNQHSREEQHHRQGSYPGADGALVAGGCISQFYGSPAADGEGLPVPDANGVVAYEKRPSAEEAAASGARVQQLLRTSQVHMKKRGSVRSSSSAADPAGSAAAAAGLPAADRASAAGAGAAY